MMKRLSILFVGSMALAVVLLAGGIGPVILAQEGDSASVIVPPPPEPSVGSIADETQAWGSPASGENEAVGPLVDGGPPDPALAGPLTMWFDAANFDTNAITTPNWYFIPPDPIGAAGPNHVVNVVNVTVEFWQKNGTNDYQQSLKTFFAPLNPVNFLFDPKVVYDHHENRFVIVALERVFSSPCVDPSPQNTSRILVAVSDDSNPNGNWYYLAINSKLSFFNPNVGLVCEHWADYPGLEVDEEAVYITNNMYTCCPYGVPPAQQYGGGRLWIIDKGVTSGGFYSGGAPSWAIYDPRTVTGSRSYTQMPALIHGNPGGTIGTWLVGYSGITDGGANLQLEVIEITDPLGVGGGPFFGLQTLNWGIVGTDDTGLASSLPDAPQLGTAWTIEVNDRRALDAVWRNNYLYFTTTIMPGTGPDAYQTTAHWFQIDTSVAGGFTIKDQGNIGAEDLGLDTFTYFPAVAVNQADTVGFGFCASNEMIYPGAYYTCRTVVDPVGTVQPTGILAAGVDWYYRAFGGSRNRWGDYTGMSVDPSDDKTFWVFNQYALRRGTVLPAYPAEDGRWGTRFGSFGCECVKWTQSPDTTEYGIDIRVDSGDGRERVLADDFRCDKTSLLTDVHFWGSWDNDEVGKITNIHLSIHSDDPVGLGGSDPYNQYSMPDQLLWQGDFSVFNMTLYYDLGTIWEAFWDPITGRYKAQGDHKIWKIDIDIPPDQAFLQRGSPDNPKIYWLDISVDIDPAYGGEFGWKTSRDHWNDDAVWAEDDGVTPILWHELIYPPEHELAGTSIDLAFELTFTPAEEPPPEYQLEFSLDIGSDTELSDPYVDGDEGFDPGDVYLGGPYHVYGPWYRPVTPPIQPGGRDGFKDDATILFAAAIIDPPPDPPDLAVPPATAVPIGNNLGVAQYVKYFDLDGHDELNFSLEDYQYPWEQVAGPCIFEAKYLYISYDDDMATGWPSGSPLQADVPVIVSSPAGISSYGSDSTWDELLGLTVTPGLPYPYMIVAGPTGIADEKAVHPDLKPDPTVLEKDDDDVDSLDITEYNEAEDPYGDPDQLVCPYWLFSADHEANMGLDPGDIYQVDRRAPGTPPIVVVDDIVHLGFQPPNDSVDIDAFEFVWAPVAGTAFNALAVLFSVDEDDPLTLVDESGGRDPRTIYISFMNGHHDVFLDPLADDIDALSNWSEAFEIGDMEPPAIEAAVSVKTHGTIGDFSINVLDRSNYQDVECRIGGATKVVIDFDENIQRVNNDLTDVSLSSGTVLTISAAGNQLTVTMQNTTDGVPLKITFPGIADADDITLVVLETLCIRQLEADARADWLMSINAADRLDVRNQMGMPVTASNFRCDVRSSDGSINAGDRLDVRNRMGNGFVGTCP